MTKKTKSDKKEDETTPAAEPTKNTADGTKAGPGTFAANPPTQAMQGVGLSFGDMSETISHLCNLLETDGATYADFARSVLKMVGFFTNHDMGQLITGLATAGSDFKKIAADIRAEFGL